MFSLVKDAYLNRKMVRFAYQFRSSARDRVRFVTRVEMVDHENVLGLRL